MKKILITRKLIKSSEEYAAKIFEVIINKKDEVLKSSDIIEKSSDCDGILSSVTDRLDSNTICAPSGDHEGLRSIAGLSVSRVWSDDIQWLGAEGAACVEDFSSRTTSSV